MHIRIAYIHTNLYSAKNRENESEYTGHTLSKRELQWLRRYDEVSGYCRGDAMRVIQLSITLPAGLLMLHASLHIVTVPLSDVSFTDTSGWTS